MHYSDSKLQMFSEKESGPGYFHGFPLSRSSLEYLHVPHLPQGDTAVAVSEQRNLTLHQSCQENQKQHQYISTYLLAQSEKPCQQAHLLGMRYCSVRTQQLTAANPETPCASHPASFRSYLQSSVLSSGNIADLIKLCFNQKTYL